jgi:hypothetical protein
MAAQREERTFQALSTCLDSLGLQGLACLACCSKRLKEACRLVMCSDVLRLLQGALQSVPGYADARVMNNTKDTAALWREATQCMHAVLWLLRAVPNTKVAAAAVSDCCSRHHQCPGIGQCSW